MLPLLQKAVAPFLDACNKKRKRDKVEPPKKRARARVAKKSREQQAAAALAQNKKLAAIAATGKQERALAAKITRAKKERKNLFLQHTEMESDGIKLTLCEIADDGAEIYMNVDTWCHMNRVYNGSGFRLPPNGCVRLLARYQKLCPSLQKIDGHTCAGFASFCNEEGGRINHPLFQCVPAVEFIAIPDAVVEADRDRESYAGTEPIGWIQYIPAESNNERTQAE